ncbi:MAG: hypothetical protein IKE43_06600 [Coriobacteriales bacterium]|nr:hypothetical protein [Coriobacteriales bacterium]
MNNVQEVLLKLLCEIDSICKTAAISYSLVDKLAFDAVTKHGFVDNTYVVSICMSIQGYAAFKERVSSSAYSGRSLIECSSDTGPVTHAYYADTTTTLIDISRTFDQQIVNIAVRIELPTYDLDGTLCYHPFWIDSVSLPPIFFQMTESIKFETASLSISQFYRSMFTSIFKDEWACKKWPYRTPLLSDSIYSSVTVPFSKFSQNLNTQGIDYEVFLDKYRALAAWNKKVLKPAQKRVTKNNYAITLTEYRYILWQKYAAHKDEILQAWQEGKKGAVKSALRLYTTLLIEFYNESGIAICFDKDLFELAVDVIKNTDPAFDDNTLRKAIPQDHLSPLEVPVPEQHNPIYALEV